MSDARTENLESMEKSPVGLQSLDGAQLPRDLFERFIERTQEESELLNMVRVEDLPRKEMAVPKIGVPELSGDTRDEDGNRPETSDVDSGAIEFNVTDQYYFIKYDLKEDAVENTVTSADEVADLILGHFERAWANDVQNLAINAGREGSGLPDSLDETFDGFIAIAEGADEASDRIGIDADDETVDSMPTYIHTDDGTDAGESQPVNTELFNEMIQTVPERFRDPDNQVIMVSKSQIQQYHFDLTEREDGLGVAVLQGDSDVTPFDHDIVGVSYWPDDIAMLIDPEQLSYGLYDGLEITQITDSDKTMDEALHSRNLMEGQFDFQIEELQSGALATDIAEP